MSVKTRMYIPEYGAYGEKGSYVVFSIPAKTDNMEKVVVEPVLLKSSISDDRNGYLYFCDLLYYENGSWVPIYENQRVTVYTTSVDDAEGETAFWRNKILLCGNYGDGAYFDYDTFGEVYQGKRMKFIARNSKIFIE